MSQTSCDIASCKSTLGISCHCCNKIYCLDHLNEHYEFINAQLNPLLNEINDLVEQITNKTKNKLIGHCLEKLNLWRDECHTMIESFYEKKCQELATCYTQQTVKQRKDIDDIQVKINKLIHQQDATQEDIEQLKLTIQSIQYQIKELHQISFQIHIRPLEFHDNVIAIEETKIKEMDFSVLLSPYRTIDRLDNYNVTCATNGQFLLIQTEKELQLLDKQLAVVKTMPWRNTGIYDLCWSSMLERFIILTTDKEIRLLNENLTINDQIHIHSKQMWWRCTCSDTSLYLLSLKSNREIFQFNLQSSFELIKSWKISHLSKEHDMIMDITYNNQTLSLLIKNQYQTTLELRSSTTFDRLWSFQFDTKHYYIHSSMYCCLLNHNDWLILDYINSCLLHVDENGKLLSTSKYNSSPINAILFHSNILVINTNNSWNFHQI